jgi:hypothetical protein
MLYAVGKSVCAPSPPGGSFIPRPSRVQIRISAGIVSFVYDMGFWGLKTCNLVDEYLRFEGTGCLHFQGRRVILFAYCIYSKAEWR